jgi:hypothetical protein
MYETSLFVGQIPSLHLNLLLEIKECKHMCKENKHPLIYKISNVLFDVGVNVIFFFLLLR